MQTLDIECKNINYSSICSDSLDESKIIIKTGDIFINKAASNGARYMAFLQEDSVEVEVVLQCMNLYSGTSIRKISDDIVYRQSLEQDETKNLKEMDNGIIKTLSNEAVSEASSSHIGRISSLLGNFSLTKFCSLAFIQFLLPLTVLISPL